MAVSKDGRLLLTASGNMTTFDPTIKVWRLSDGAFLKTLSENGLASNQFLSSQTYGIAFSPDGQCFATGGTNGAITIWRTADFAPVQVLYSSGLIKGFYPSILSLVYTPDGKFLAGGSSKLISSNPVATAGIIDFWNVPQDCADEWGLEQTLTHGMVVNSISFHPNFPWMASSADGDHVIKVWNYQQATVVQTLSSSLFPVGATFTPDGGALIANLGEGNDRYQLVAWETQTWQPTLMVADARPPFSISPDSNTLISARGVGSQAQIEVWDLQTGSPRYDIGGQRNWVGALTFGPTSDTFFSGGGEWDQRVEVWTLSDPPVVARVLSAHTAPIQASAFSKDGNLFASADGQEGLSGGASIRVWNTRDGTEVTALRGHTGGVASVVFSPTAPLLASSGFDQTARITNLQTGETTELRGHVGWVASVDFSPGGDLLASGGRDGQIRIWDVASAQTLKVFVGHTFTVASVAFSPDGTRLASGSYDGSVKLWDVASGAELWTVSFGGTRGFSAVAFSPDGSTLAAANESNGITLLDVQTGAELKAFVGHRAPVACLGFSPDGAMLASGSEDRSLRLWDVRTAASLQVYTDIDQTGSGVISVAFSPQGDLIGYGRLDAAVVMARNPYVHSIFP